MKVEMFIFNKYEEQSMTGRGTRYRYIINDKYKTSGSFSIELLSLYKEIYNIIIK